MRWTLLGLLALVVACKRAPDAPLPDTVLAGFATPETVLYDPLRDVYLVSNIRGQATAKDGNGSIARVTPEGKIQYDWVVGGQKGVQLDAPKGMAIGGDVLYVADIDVVRKLDAGSGAPLGSVPIPGSTFLNAVSVAPDGTVWVTDTGLGPDFSPNGTAAIYAIERDGTVRPVAKGADIDLPNGIVATAAGAYVVTWGSGEFMQVDAKGRRTVLVKAPAAQLDGLVRIAEGRWICTSWAGKCLYEFDTSGSARKLEGIDVEQPAGLGYDSRRGRLLIPLFGKDDVVVRRL